MVTVTIQGDREIKVKLDRLPRRTLEEVEDATDTVAGEELRELQRYPSPPQGSRYVRTGTLAGGWEQPAEKVAFGAGGFSKSFTNTVDYSGYVQGEEQAWMHRGRWDTAEDIHQRYQARYEAAAQRAVDRASGDVG